MPPPSFRAARPLPAVAQAAKNTNAQPAHTITRKIRFNMFL
jgi:hypothetical protein